MQLTIKFYIMKNSILIILLISLYVSCSSAKTTKQAINTGNYDKAIAVAIKKLKSNKTKKSNQQYVIMLEEAFNKASKRDLERINFLKKDANPENLESIYTAYVLLKNRQESIKPLLPLPVLEKGTNARFNFKDYNNDIIESKEKLSEYLYNKVLESVDSQDKNNLRSVYYDLEYIEEINPNYKDTRNLINEVHERGTDYVLVSMKNETDKIVPVRLEQDLLNFDTYGLNDLWTVYHNAKNEEVNYDFGLELNLRDIQVSPEQIREKEFVTEKQIKDGYKYLLDDNGNQVKDSLGNKIKVDKFLNVRCELYEFTQFKSARVAGQVIYIDYNANQLLQTFPIESEYIFEHRYANYRGDKRALDRSYLDLITLREVVFPSNEQMVYDTGNDLKQKLKHIITKNGFRK